MTKINLKKALLKSRKLNFILIISGITALLVLGFGLLYINNSKEKGNAFASFDATVLQVQQVIGVSPEPVNLVNTPADTLTIVPERGSITTPIANDPNNVNAPTLSRPIESPTGQTPTVPRSTPISIDKPTTETTTPTTTPTAPATSVNTPKTNQESTKTPTEAALFTPKPIENCANISNNLNLALVTYQKTIELFQQKYDNLDVKLSKLIAQSELEKKDVKSLKELSQKLQNEISLFRSNSQIFLSGVEQAKSSACTKSAKEFGDLLLKSRDSLSQVAVNAQKIEVILQQNIQAELKKFN